MGDKEKIILLEFLIETLEIDHHLTSRPELRDGSTVINFTFFDLPPLEFTEEALPIGKNKRNQDFKSGKSCLFSVRDFPVIPRELLDVEVQVIRELPEGVFPNRLPIAMTRIDLTPIFENIIRESRLPPCTMPITKSHKECFLLTNLSGTRIAGSIGVFIRASCFGKMIVSQFQVGSEQSYLFKGNQSTSYTCENLNPVGESKLKSREKMLAKNLGPRLAEDLLHYKPLLNVRPMEGWMAEVKVEPLKTPNQGLENNLQKDSQSQGLQKQMEGQNLGQGQNQNLGQGQNQEQSMGEVTSKKSVGGSKRSLSTRSSKSSGKGKKGKKSKSYAIPPGGRRPSDPNPPGFPGGKEMSGHYPPYPPGTELKDPDGKPYPDPKEMDRKSREQDFDIRGLPEEILKLPSKMQKPEEEGAGIPLDQSPDAAMAKEYPLLSSVPVQQPEGKYMPYPPPIPPPQPPTERYRGLRYLPEGDFYIVEEDYCDCDKDGVCICDKLFVPEGQKKLKIVKEIGTKVHGHIVTVRIPKEDDDSWLDIDLNEVLNKHEHDPCECCECAEAQDVIPKNITDFIERNLCCEDGGFYPPIRRGSRIDTRVPLMNYEGFYLSNYPAGYLDASCPPCAGCQGSSPCAPKHEIALVDPGAGLPLGMEIDMACGLGMGGMDMGGMGGMGMCGDMGGMVYSSMPYNQGPQGYAYPVRMHGGASIASMGLPSGQFGASTLLPSCGAGGGGGGGGGGGCCGAGGGGGGGGGGGICGPSGGSGCNAGAQQTCRSVGVLDKPISQTKISAKAPCQEPPPPGPVAVAPAEPPHPQARFCSIKEYTGKSHIQIKTPPDPDNDIFVLRISKKGDPPCKRPQLELELKTPKRTLPVAPTQEEKEVQAGEEKGNKGKKGKKGKKKK